MFTIAYHLSSPYRDVHGCFTSDAQAIAYLDVDLRRVAEKLGIVFYPEKGEVFTITDVINPTHIHISEVQD